jgi:hypothetical protein
MADVTALAVEHHCGEGVRVELDHLGFMREELVGVSSQLVLLFLAGELELVLHLSCGSIRLDEAVDQVDDSNGENDAEDFHFQPSGGIELQRLLTSVRTTDVSLFEDENFPAVLTL